jgi:hypothetical protein
LQPMICWQGPFISVTGIESSLVRLENDQMHDS